MMKGLVVLAALLAIISAENIALNKQASASSIAYEGMPGRAVDGNESTDYESWSCTHTNSERNARWWVDLAQKYTVSSVEIINRGDCCSDRLRKFDIYVTNQQPGNDHRYYDAQRCKRVVDTFEGTKKFECDKSIVGRFVVIRFYDNEARPLTLCEVKVEGTKEASNGAFCHRPKSDCDGRDIQSLSDVSLEECQQACQAKHDCVSIQYNSGKGCYLKNYICEDKELRESESGNDYVLVESADQCPLAFEHCYRDKVDCKGHDFASYHGISEAQCRMRCAVTKACASIQFNSGGCFLKNFACANFEVMGSGSGHDYIKVGSTSDCKYMWYIFD